MGTTTSGGHNETPVKCQICRQAIDPACDWRQGRCPHRPVEFISIIDFFKQLFKIKK
jgi:hypothetical protein